MQKRGSSSSRSNRGRYRTVAPFSQVEETLFGSTKPKNSAPLDKDGSKKNDKEEFIQVIGKDYIRSIRIPQKDPLKESIILKSTEFEKIASQTQWLHGDNRQDLRHASEKEEAKKAAEERKRQIIEAEFHRKNNHVLTDLDIEAQSRAQHLMEQADALRMEQEEEVKQLNQLILGAKCQAIWDEQIQEKKQIQEEMAKEETRLDTLMEVERCKALEVMEKTDKERREQRFKGMQEICNQMQQRQEDKLIEDEMKEMEKLQIREKQEEMILEDIKDLEKKRKEQQLLQEEIMRINTETMQAKERRMEQEKLANNKAMEYMKKKCEREAEYEEQQMQIKKEKELEIARLRAQQEREKSYKAEQDEIRARRNQETAEREWRVKEKERVAKKVHEEAMLKAARLEQVKNKEHCQSIEVGREKAMFERVLKAQQEAMINQKEQEEKQRQKAEFHTQAICKQMKERELSAAAKRTQLFQEADRLKEEAQQRQIRLDKIKEKKLQELKATGIPDKYCVEVERKAQKTFLA